MVYEAAGSSDGMNSGHRNIVFLPATDPGDTTFGAAPEIIKGHPSASIHQLNYQTVVWYNETIRTEAIRQIERLGIDSIILVGFSKSGLGAWNIARAIPDRIAGTIIFDAPVAGEDRRQWRTGPFYRDDTSWLKDLPIQTIREFQTVMPKAHKLVLISGESFHQEMCTLSQAIAGTGLEHVFLPHPHLKHHWNSGWIEEGLNELLGGSFDSQA